MIIQNDTDKMSSDQIKELIYNLCNELFIRYALRQSDDFWYYEEQEFKAGRTTSSIIEGMQKRFANFYVGFNCLPEDKSILSKEVCQSVLDRLFK
jgi:hypothetical protein